MDFKESFDKFIKDAKRVLKVSRKPDGKEYLDLAKVSALIYITIIEILFFRFYFGK